MYVMSSMIPVCLFLTNGSLILGICLNDRWGVHILEDLWLLAMHKEYTIVKNLGLYNFEVQELRLFRFTSSDLD